MDKIIETDHTRYRYYKCCVYVIIIGIIIAFNSLVFEYFLKCAFLSDAITPDSLTGYIAIYITILLVSFVLTIVFGSALVFEYWNIWRQKHSTVPFFKIDKEIIELKKHNSELERLCEDLEHQMQDEAIEKDEMVRTIESLIHTLDNANKIKNIDAIYDLYQIFLLFRKYHITKYEIFTQPEVSAHAYIPMSVYTKISIHKELLNTVHYHIDGTDVIIKGGLNK